MSHLTRVKICGITSVADAQDAMAAGADAVGLVFYEPSPRHISDLGLAREIAAAVGPFVSVVALTVNAEPRPLESIVREVPLQVLQFHGDELESQCVEYGRPYVKALRMQKDLDVRAAIAQYSSAAGILLDTYVKGVPGGTGETFNWESVPLAPSKPLVLAGGLNPSNVTAAIRVTEPYAVDVSGGVEAAPGKKDKHKMIAFVKNAKSETIRDD